MRDLPVQIAEVFDACPPNIRDGLLELRNLILEVAKSNPEVGELTEMLKWGQPAFLTEQTKSGSTIRLGWSSTEPSQYALYFHCRTNLVASFRMRFGRQLSYEGNRAVVFDCTSPPPWEIVRECVESALTYHLHRRF